MEEFALPKDTRQHWKSQMILPNRLPQKPSFGFQCSTKNFMAASKTTK